MKYSISGKQPKETLALADEIKFSINDFGRFIDTIEQFPEKTYIIAIPKESKEEPDWEKLAAFAQKVNLILCIDNLALAPTCRAHHLSFYWSYPVFTWYELAGIIPLEPAYITVNAPISFSLDKIKQKTSIPLRLCPNLAYDAYIPRANGIYGTWVRPEDISAYEPYIDVFDFITDDLGKERTLFHVYKENGNWPGNLNLLLTNLNVNVDNRAIPEEIGKMRTTCGQRCMEGSHCHACENAFKFSNSVRKLHYKLKS